jgi:hypothetical protein
LALLGLHLFTAQDEEGRSVNQATAQVTPGTDAKLVGIGGWLLLLIVKLWIGSVVLIFSGIVGTNHLGTMLVIGLGVLSGAAALLLTITNRKGVLLAKIFLALEAAYFLFELLPPVSSDNTFKTTEFLILTVLYLIYLFRSKRVKNTYFPQPTL